MRGTGAISTAPVAQPIALAVLALFLATATGCCAQLGDEEPVVVVAARADFLEAAAATTPPATYLLFQEHVDLSGISLDATGLPLTWLGNCTGPPAAAVAAALARPLTPRQCVVLASPGLVRFGTVEGHTLMDLVFLLPPGGRRGAPVEVADVSPFVDTSAPRTLHDPPAIVTSLDGLRLYRVGFVGDGAPARGVKARGELYIEESYFAGFLAPLGAAAYLRLCKAIIVATVFENNAAARSPCYRASGAGPAISVYTDSSDAGITVSALWLQQCVFSNNTVRHSAAAAAPISAASHDCRVFSTDAGAPTVFYEDGLDVSPPWHLGTSAGPRHGAAQAWPARLQPQFWVDAYDFALVPPTVTVQSTPRQLVPHGGLFVSPPSLPQRDVAWVATAGQLQAALREGVTHVLVTRHLDLTPLGEAARPLWSPTTTQTIRGSCGDEAYPEDAPARTNPRQCLLRVSQLVLFLQGTHTTRLWLADLVLALELPTRGLVKPVYDYYSYYSDYDYNDYPAPAGVSGGGPASACADVPSDSPIAAPPPPEGAPPARHFGAVLALASAQLWMTGVVTHGGGVVTTRAIDARESSLYARDCQFNDFYSEYTDVSNCSPDLVKVAAAALFDSNATLVSSTFADNRVRLGTECYYGASAVKLEETPGIRGTPFLWMEDARLLNNSVVYGSAAPASGPLARRRLLAADSAHGKPATAVAAARAGQVFSSSALPVLDMLEGTVAAAPSTRTANASDLGVMSEGDAWFAAISQDQAAHSGLPSLRLAPTAPEGAHQASPSNGGDSGSEASGTDLGAILGGALGGLVLVAAIGGGIVGVQLHRGKTQQRVDRQAPESPSEPLKADGSSCAKPVAMMGEERGLFAYQVPKMPLFSPSEATTVSNETLLLPTGTTLPATNEAAGPSQKSPGQCDTDATFPSADRHAELPTDTHSALVATLALLRAHGGLFYGDFVVEAEQHREGGQGLVQFLKRQPDGRGFVAKFFFDLACLEREASFYGVDSISAVLPDVEALVPNGDGAVRAPNGFVYPPFIIAERGESLDEWARRVAPDGVTAMFVLTHIAKRLQLLHAAGLSHRDLKPANILWRPRTNSWTLIDFGCAAWHGEPAQLFFSLRYAAPEMLQAMESGKRETPSSPAVDVWALGLIAYELLTGTRAFEGETARADVISRILGRLPLPWESVEGEDAAALFARLGHLRRSVLSCLERDPARRPTALEVLNSWNSIFETTTAISMS